MTTDTGNKLYFEHLKSISNLELMVRHPFAAPWITRKHNSGFSSLVEPLERYASLYLIIHRPTGAVYVGKSESSTAAAMRQWRSRLAAISGTPPLNVAFRAVYTSRYDFDFALARVQPCIAKADYDADFIKAYDSLYREVRALYPKGQCLNVEKPSVERSFWIRHLGLTASEAYERFELPTRDRDAMAAINRLRQEADQRRRQATLQDTIAQARNEHAITAAPDTGNGGQPVVRKKIIIPGYNDGTS